MPYTGDWVHRLSREELLLLHHLLRALVSGSSIPESQYLTAQGLLLDLEAILDRPDGHLPTPSLHKPHRKPSL